MEGKLSSPDRLFDHARLYQTLLTNLQEEINFAIEEAQTAVSQVLRTSTTETLRQYENHAISIEGEYAPHQEAFEQLIPGSCKNTAETILNTVKTFTGFEASNCAKAYDNVVREIIESTSGSLVNFDDVYSELQSIIVKAFIAKNIFINSEEIEETISDMFELVQTKWNETKPEFDDLRRNLALAIGLQNIQLGSCHESIKNVATDQFAFFRSMVNTCNDFNSPQSVSERTGRISGPEPWIQKLKEFEEQFAKLESFKWQYEY